MQVAVDVAEVIGGRDHLDGHHRLEHLRAGARRSLPEGHGCGELEGPCRRIALVESAGEQGRLKVDEREGREHASPGRRHVLAGDRTADARVRKTHALAARQRRDA